jgi:hypothetical protein
MRKIARSDLNLLKRSVVIVEIVSYVKAKKIKNLAEKKTSA